MNNYSILIPAYNSANSLPILLDQIKLLTHRPNSIIVVDDGSTDKTTEVIEECNVRHVRLKKNFGKGYALRTGFKEFLTKTDSDYLICMDADLQHPVGYIENFLSAVSSEGQLLLIGNRDRNFRQMPLLRILSNTITSFMLSLITGHSIKDSQCGFRLIDRSSLSNLELTEDGFQLESEMILQAAKADIPIKFIDIPTIYNGNRSNINHVGDTYLFLKLIIKEIFRIR